MVHGMPAALFRGESRATLNGHLDCDLGGDHANDPGILCYLGRERSGECGPALFCHLQQFTMVCVRISNAGRTLFLL
jgi:hypothetical protein